MWDGPVPGPHAPHARSVTSERLASGWNRSRTRPVARACAYINRLAAIVSNGNRRRLRLRGGRIDSPDSRHPEKLSPRTEAGKQNNCPEVFQRQVRNYNLCQTIFYSEPGGNDRKAPAAFVEDNLVIMGLMATFRRLMAAEAALPPALSAPTPPP